MDEKKKKIIENVIVGVIVLGIVVGIVALDDAAPEPWEPDPLPTPVDGVYDFDKYLQWIRFGSDPSNSSSEKYYDKYTVYAGDEELDYSIVFVDGALEDYKGEVFAQDLIWTKTDKGETIYCNIYYPIGKDNRGYLLAELSNGGWVLLSLFGWI
ncbi:MAG: hypothetical protein IJB92_02825 [Clostridia bacterium]|nr:hypothetical protein [Clostridia bacterium]